MIKVLVVVGAAFFAELGAGSQHSSGVFFSDSEVRGMILGSHAEPTAVAPTKHIIPKDSNFSRVSFSAIPARHGDELSIGLGDETVVPGLVAPCSTVWNSTSFSIENGFTDFGN